ncbi:uncharacterized protein LOC133369272 [Rhineura floridana]|uniref:uncharacterized protein LOC133369272 n=1 Tax=Rhineura floridana TaxID=261503 RepID=UPI002AC806DD|nr:uncharacterized protein LOC133369272 [Rhineura floridana]
MVFLLLAAWPGVPSPEGNPHCSSVPPSPPPPLRRRRRPARPPPSQNGGRGGEQQQPPRVLLLRGGLACAASCCCSSARGCSGKRRGRGGGGCSSGGQRRATFAALAVTGRASADAQPLGGGSSSGRWRRREPAADSCPCGLLLGALRLRPAGAAGAGLQLGGDEADGAGALEETLEERHCLQVPVR